MYVTDAQILEMEAKYGHPVLRHFTIPVTGREYDRIKTSQKDGRNHDFTVYIIKDGRVVVNAKHPYPDHLYRAPSGGVHPGEDFETAIHREVMEETGCQVEIDRFFLRTSVDFTREDGAVIRWRSFVFLAHYEGGEFKFTDHREIRSVKLADWSEFNEFGRIMRSTDTGGLHYRAALHEAVVEVLGDLVKEGELAREIGLRS
jgi:ADP-ribose pyrophosphatase YjhB (NUDIX family)